MLRRFFEGVSQPYEDARTFVDDVSDDLDPTRTRELEHWEQQFGLLGGVSEDDRRRAVDAEWKATGGQSPRYLQDVMQAAGFDVYVYEWWSSGPPYVARNPRNYTTDPLIGDVQCGEPLALCGEPTAVCNAFLANEPGYIVNRNLTRVAPPRVPTDPTKWPYFLYWGGPTFLEEAYVVESRRDEFERLLLKICPAQQWLVVKVIYVPELGVVTIDGDPLTLDGDPDPVTI